MDKDKVLRNIFELTEKRGIDYIVLRNHGSLPQQISVDNDIDLLIKPGHKRNFIELMRFLRFKHRVDSKNDNIYFYGSKPHEHFISQQLDIHIDVVFNVAYRSPNRGEWIPAHQEIQESMWENRERDNDFIGKWKPSSLDELLHIIAHCIFDKKNISDIYRERILYLYQKVDKERFQALLRHLFFNFTAPLIDLIKKKNMDNIFERYISFCGY